jgi:Peptidase family M1 domain
MEYEMFGAIIFVFISAGFLMQSLSTDEIVAACVAAGELEPDREQVIDVKDLIITQGDGSFLLEKGRVVLFRPVLGSPRIAYFQGKGRFRTAPEDSLEQRSLIRYTSGKDLDLPIKKALFYSSDSHIEQLLAGTNSTRGKWDRKLGKSLDEFLKDQREFFGPVRVFKLLSALVAEPPRSYFRCYFEIRRGNFLEYLVDPWSPPTIQLNRYLKKGEKAQRLQFEKWLSYPAAKTHLARNGFDVVSTMVDMTIDGEDSLKVYSEAIFNCAMNGERLIPVGLSGNLKLQIADINESICQVIQWDEWTPWLILQEPLGESSDNQLRCRYGGTGLVGNVGGNNYIVVGRNAWYPSLAPEDLRSFRMNFRVPKGMSCLGSGRLIREWEENDHSCSAWESIMDCDGVGFNYGHFESISGETDGFQINLYSSASTPDVRGYSQPSRLASDHAAAEVVCSELSDAYQIYQGYFGPTPFKQLSVSQQPFDSFGQSLHGLVYLPISSFFQNQTDMGIGRANQELNQFKEAVGPHLVAYSWWGNGVYFLADQAQWMSTGFAEYSAALWAMKTKGMADFLALMLGLKDAILADADKNRKLNDIGPLALGSRLGGIDKCSEYSPYLLLYNKGAYVLHMLRMMMFDYNAMDDLAFRKMMHDFTATYTGKMTGTEDFKSIVEKHMGTDMTWFFNQWVYDTPVPHYRFGYEAQPTDDGQYELKVRIKQENVPEHFKMPVNLLVEFESGYVGLKTLVKGLDDVEASWVLPAAPTAVKLNPLEDVLSTSESY